MESDGLSRVCFCRFRWTWNNVRYCYVTFTGNYLGIDGQVNLTMVSTIFSIKSKLNYVAFLILKHTQIAKVLWKIWCRGSVLVKENWFLKTWLPHIKRWWLAYRPNDLILWNTNNGTDIAYNHKPQQRTYNQSVMRKRLLAQLENETMTSFPQKTKRVKRGKRSYTSLPIILQMPGVILRRWFKGRIFHGVLLSFRRVVPQEIWKYSCGHFSWRKKVAVWKCSKCK